MTIQLKDLAKRRSALARRKSALSKKLDTVKYELDQIELSLLNDMKAASLESFRVGGTTYSRGVTEFPALTDADAFFAYVAKKKDWDLIRKQCNSGAAKARWEAGVQIPGVKRESKIVLYVNKARS